MDSGASLAFTNRISDFSDLIFFTANKRPSVSTANGFAIILGFGTVFIETKPEGEAQITRIHPVYYLPTLSDRLLSLGQILHGNLCIYGDENTLTFSDVKSKRVVLKACSGLLHQNIYWVDTHIITGNALYAFSSMHDDSYQTWHRRLGHPSDQVLTKFKSQTRNFPQSLKIPKSEELPICEGCAKGKMRSRPFPENPVHAAKPFE